MAPDTLSPTLEQPEISIDQEVQRHVREAAEAAETLGDVREEVRSRARKVIERGQSGLGDALERQGAEMEQVIRGYEGVTVDDLEDGVMGNNHIGKGDSPMNISRDIVGKTEELERTLAHESAHGEQADIATTDEDVAVIIDGEEVSSLELLEGDAERAAAKAVDGDAAAHREGQPAEVYGSGQKKLGKIIDALGEDEVESVLRKDGDRAGQIEALQGKLWKAQLERDSTGDTLGRITREAQETGHDIRELLAA